MATFQNALLCLPKNHMAQGEGLGVVRGGNQIFWVCANLIYLLLGPNAKIKKPRTTFQNYFDIHFIFIYLIHPFSAQHSHSAMGVPNGWIHIHR